MKLALLEGMHIAYFLEYKRKKKKTSKISYCSEYVMGRLPVILIFKIVVIAIFVLVKFYYQWRLSSVKLPPKGNQFEIYFY